MKLSTTKSDRPHLKLETELALVYEIGDSRLEKRLRYLRWRERQDTDLREVRNSKDAISEPKQANINNSHYDLNQFVLNGSKLFETLNPNRTTTLSLRPVPNWIISPYSISSLHLHGKQFQLKAWFLNNIQNFC